VLKINIIAQGRLKEPYWESACAEYEKRLGAYCGITVTQIPENAEPSVPSGAFCAALCAEGDMLTSEQFAEKLRALQNTGISRLCFLIGGSSGLGEETKRRADMRLSLSRMTWPHHMARAMLEEQLYRALNILAGGKYHK
jgi:23S rRNA (pseudouridine1915-N3)-methyltransferase